MTSPNAPSPITFPGIYSSSISPVFLRTKEERDNETASVSCFSGKTMSLAIFISTTSLLVLPHPILILALNYSRKYYRANETYCKTIAWCLIVDVIIMIINVILCFDIFWYVHIGRTIVIFNKVLNIMRSIVIINISFIKFRVLSPCVNTIKGPLSSWITIFYICLFCPLLLELVIIFKIWIPRQLTSKCVS